MKVTFLRSTTVIAEVEAETVAEALERLREVDAETDAGPGYAKRRGVAMRSVRSDWKEQPLPS